MAGRRRRLLEGAFAMAMLAVAGVLPFGAIASDFSQPWRRSDRALVIDAYEYNRIDWQKLAGDKRIVGFISKATDGMPPPFACPGADMEVRLCQALWKRYEVVRELFRTRRTIAKAMGLKWGAYHLARPGNPIDQANHFLDFAEPGPDDLVALDIEENDPAKWMSLADAEEFARHIMRRIGRYPVLYTNEATAAYIADNRSQYPLLARLPLWYARYKPEIDTHFPKGNWESYTLWQFSSLANCSERRCSLRIAGTPPDIDVNVAAMTPEELREAWPLAALAPDRQERIASVPVPLPRESALAGDAKVIFAAVDPASDVAMLAAAYAEAGERYPNRGRSNGAGLLAALVSLRNEFAAYVATAFATLGNVDPTMTASTEREAATTAAEPAGGQPAP